MITLINRAVPILKCYHVYFFVMFPLFFDWQHAAKMIYYVYAFNERMELRIWANLVIIIKISRKK